MSLKIFRSGLNYKAQPEDIFIATYPKCGTTWTMNIVWLIVNGEPFPKEKKITEAMPHLEEVGAEYVTTSSLPRIIKTHLPFQLLNYNEKTKYIYCARNPLDCVVSAYYHTKGFSKLYNFENGTFDEYFDCFIEGQIDFGNYFENLKSWYVKKEKENILFILYEDMRSNTEKSINQIANFLGAKYAEKIKNSNFLEEVLIHSSFDKMSKNQERWSSKRPENMPFIRKGKVGDWRNHFTKDQLKKMNEQFESYPFINDIWSSDILT